MSVLQPRSPRMVILEEPGGPGLLLPGKWIPRPGHPARGGQEKQGTNLWSRYQRICNLPALLSFHILSPRSCRRKGTPLPRARDRDCHVCICGSLQVCKGVFMEGEHWWKEACGYWVGSKQRIPLVFLFFLPFCLGGDEVMRCLNSFCEAQLLKHNDDF